MQDTYDEEGRTAFADSLTWKIHGVYAVRASIHQRYPYDTSSHAYSDDNTTRLHFLASRRVVATDADYYYRQHDQSVTHRIDGHRFDYLLANQSMKRQLLSLQVDDALVSLYENERWKISLTSASSTISTIASSVARIARVDAASCDPHGKV